MYFELYHVQHLMSTRCESCLEQIVLTLYGAFISISQSDGVEGRVCFGGVNVLPCTAVSAASASGRETSPCVAVIWETSIENLALLLWPDNEGSGVEDAKNRLLEDLPTWVRKCLDGEHKNGANMLNNVVHS